MGYNKEEGEKFIKIINEKKIQLVCPMCKSQNFFLLEGYFNTVLQENIQNILLGGLSVPSVPFVCSTCGFISQHAIGILDKKDKSNEHK